MAPEQFVGNNSPKVDQYALAVVLYELIVGELPFSINEEKIQRMLAENKCSSPPTKEEWEQATEDAFFIEHSQSDIPLLPEDVPWEVEQIIRKALSKNPSDRYNSVQDFVEEFSTACKTFSELENESSKEFALAS